MRFNTLPQWLDWLEVTHPLKIDLGLERVAGVASKMELLKPQATVITIGGTNGKGSSVSLFESIFNSAGISYGSYTSPHVHQFNERIRLNSEPVSDQQIMQAFAAIDLARGETSLSYFEFSTLAALYLVQQANVEVILLEVGLGGRLDATNIIDTDIALITNIALDHMHFLGDTVELIAVEKAAIARRGKPMICAATQVTPVLAREAKKHGARFIQAGVDYTIKINDDDWQWQSQEEHYQLPPPGLQGRHQYDNAAGVIAALQYLPNELQPNLEFISQGLADLNLPGRFERHQLDYEVIFDVAHNPHSALALAENLKQLEPKTTHILLGILADKDYRGLVTALGSVAEYWHLSSAQVERALEVENLEKSVLQIEPDAHIHCYPSLVDAWKHLNTTLGSDERLIVTGSFHTVDEVRRHLNVAELSS